MQEGFDPIDEADFFAYDEHVNYKEAQKHPTGPVVDGVDTKICQKAMEAELPEGLVHMEIPHLGGLLEPVERLQEAEHLARHWLCKHPLRDLETSSSKDAYRNVVVTSSCSMCRPSEAAAVVIILMLLNRTVGEEVSV